MTEVTASWMAIRHASWESDGEFLITEYSRHLTFGPISSKTAKPVPLRDGSIARIRME
jgi:hypothetical protein